jgi:ankyrin repeat protein
MLATDLDNGILELLMHQGADVHAKNQYGDTALHWAAYKGNQAAVQVSTSTSAVLLLGS